MAAAPALSNVESYKADVAKLLTRPGPHYVVFSSDLGDDGQTYWCPDCVRAVPGIVAAASQAGAALLEVRVGPKPSWKSPGHPFRTDPAIRLGGVPTLARLNPDGSLGQRSGPDLEGAPDAATATQLAAAFIAQTK